MKEEYFKIFSNCFSSMEISYKRFCELLHKDSCVYFESKEDNEICAFAIVEDFAIRLICVIPTKHDISARSYFRILRLSRTIADLGGEEIINEKHLLEALRLKLNYR